MPTGRGYYKATLPLDQAMNAIEIERRGLPERSWVASQQY